MTLAAADHLAVVRTHYPHAISTVTAVDRLFDLLGRHYGLAPSRIMAADSICCDDVNSIEYPPRAFEMLGPFKMGGLNSFPFAVSRAWVHLRRMCQTKARCWCITRRTLV